MHPKTPLLAALACVAVLTGCGKTKPAEPAPAVSVPAAPVAAVRPVASRTVVASKSTGKPPVVARSATGATTPAIAPAVPAAKLSATPALDPAGTINWAKQNLNAATAKEQAAAAGVL